MLGEQQLRRLDYELLLAVDELGNIRIFRGLEGSGRPFVAHLTDVCVRSEHPGWSPTGT